MVFIPHFYIILPFFVATSVLIVLDLSSFLQGEDMQYFNYVLIIFVVYLIVRFVTRSMMKNATKQGDGTFKDDDGKTYDSKGNEV